MAKGAALSGVLTLLGQENSLNVGQHTALGNGDTGEQLVQLLVVSYGQLHVARQDPGRLVVSVVRTNLGLICGGGGERGMGMAT